MKKQTMSTRNLVVAALMTALVVILQHMGAIVKFGPFSVSLVLIPIVIGTITCGEFVGAWLGFVFGLVVLATGDAAAFLAVNIPGTIITVLAKGTACGYVCGLVYKVVNKALHGKFSQSSYVAAVCAAVACPVVNTGVFLVGCFLFFMQTIASWAAAQGLGEAVGEYIIYFLVGGNFLFEMALSVIFAPAMVHILKVVNKGK